MDGVIESKFWVDPPDFLCYSQTEFEDDGEWIWFSYWYTKYEVALKVERVYVSDDRHGDNYNMLPENWTMAF